jgi:hypothetical protein
MVKKMTKYLDEINCWGFGIRAIIPSAAASAMLRENQIEGECLELDLRNHVSRL